MASFHIPGSDEGALLLDQLLNTASKNALLELCRNNRDKILSRFREWSVVPMEFRGDREKLDWYGKGLVNIAVSMAELGHAECVNILRGGDENPMEEIQKQCGIAQQQSKAGDHSGAIATLLEVTKKLSALKGNGAEFLRPRVLGLLGTSFLKVGNKAEAIRYTESALKECQLSGDEAGVKVYMQNLEYLMQL